VFARQGVEATRINEITEEVRVGFSSFYNHFSSMDDIVAAVLQKTLTGHGEAVNTLTASLEDPAEVLASAHRYLTSLARTDPETAWLLVRLETSHQVLGALRDYAKRDVARGAAAGRFAVADSDVAIRAMGGALLGVIRGILDGELGNAERLHAEGVLRTLGIAPAEAAAVASRPLPDARQGEHSEHLRSAPRSRRRDIDKNTLG
jgi:AcrR family transcriptional regulator